MRNTTTSLLGFAVLAIAGLAAAPPGALARRNSAARACAKIAADAERLACYDRVFRPARSVRHVAATERETPTHREAAKAKAGNSGHREVTIVKIRHVRQIGEAFFVTEDGHVWRQTDQRRTVFPEPPFRAVISSGFLGSHFLSPVGKRISVHVTEEPQ